MLVVNQFNNEHLVNLIHTKHSHSDHVPNEFLILDAGLGDETGL